MSRRARTLAAAGLVASATLLSGCRPAAEPADGVAGTVALPEPDSPFVAFDVWVQVGSQHDPEGKEGLAALTAALLAEGSTAEDTYTGILEQLYPMAADYAAYVDKEMTTFRGVVHRDHLEDYYRLLRNAVLRPAFAPQDFERVKSQQLDFVERGRRFLRDEELSKELLFSMAYRGTPYEHPEEGTVQSVRSLTLDDVRDFYRSHYLRGSVIVGIGGGYPQGFPERVRADFDALPEGRAPAVARPEPPRPEGLEVLIVDKDTDATAVSFGFPIDVLRGAGEDYASLFLANAWLGEHRSSFGRLYQVLRERRGLNYGDYSYVEAFPRGFTTMERPINVSRRSQLFEVWIRPVSGTGGEQDDQHDRALFALRAARREVARLANQGLPADQVERTRRYLMNNAVTFGSTLLRRLAFAIDDEFYRLAGSEPMAGGFLQGVRSALERVTVERVNEALRRHLQTEGGYLVFVTRDAEALRSKLSSGEPTPIRYPGEQSAEILAEDREIASYPLVVSPDHIEVLDILEVFEGEAGPEPVADPEAVSTSSSR